MPGGIGTRFYRAKGKEKEKIRVIIAGENTAVPNEETAAIQLFSGAGA